MASATNRTDFFDTILDSVDRRDAEDNGDGFGGGNQQGGDSRGGRTGGMG